MDKHTPGPWSLETVPTSCGVCHKVGPFPGKRDGDKPRHACLYSDYPSPDDPADQELLANARLIASAPDLLAALIVAEAALNRIRCTSHTVPWEDTGPAVEQGSTAIAKARGEATC